MYSHPQDPQGHRRKAGLGHDEEDALSSRCPKALKGISSDG